MPDPLTHWARDQTQAASVEFLTPGTTAGTPEFSYVFLILNNSMLKSSFLLKIETPLFLCIVFVGIFVFSFILIPQFYYEGQQLLGNQNCGVLTVSV